MRGIPVSYTVYLMNVPGWRQPNRDGTAACQHLSAFDSVFRPLIGLPTPSADTWPAAAHSGRTDGRAATTPKEFSGDHYAAACQV